MSEAANTQAAGWSPWAQAATAAAILAVEPCGVGGAALRALNGPVRDRWIALLRDLLPAIAPVRRVPLGVPDGRLLGGLDLAATLRAGRPVAERGLLAEADGGVILLAMAERLSPGAAARINSALHREEVAAHVGVVALDEGMDDDERPPASLLERLAFLLDLGAIGPREAMECRATRGDIAAARLLLPSVTAGEAVIEALCGTAIALGVGSVRAPILALRVARIVAALAGRVTVLDEDAALAARLVLAPRATRIPIPPAEEPPLAEPPPPEDGTHGDPADQNANHNSAEAPDDGTPRERNGSPDPDPTMDDLVLAAAQAAIPANLLAQLSAATAAGRSAPAGRSGAVVKSGLRGRPAGVRAGEPRAGRRLNIVETLRAAAPWQRLRRDPGAADGGRRIAVRRDDFRVTHYEQRSESTIIFVVDASRSSAVNRLAEAKGAVELLLADCYVRRDRVAVVAFRGRTAELLLPPTRSLVRAKRQLAGLPGGGGTPLAAGLDAAARLADAVRRRGEVPTIVLLTDGRANIARDGAANRDRAEADAVAAGRMIRAAGLASLLVDTAPRPQVAAERFAREMGARYLPLPYASATGLSRAVRAATEPSPSDRMRRIP